LVAPDKIHVPRCGSTSNMLKPSLITSKAKRGAVLLSVPLPFISGLVFALTLYRSLKGVETPGPRRYFLFFLMTYALQGMLVGLRFGYGIETLAIIQPATASLMPPLAYLAFRSLAAAPVARPWRHLAGPVLVLGSVLLLPPLVDALLVLMFTVYGVLLYRLTVEDPEAVAETSLHRAVPALRAARLTAGLMLFFAVTDAIVAALAEAYGRQTVPIAVSLMNIAAIAGVLIYYFLPEPASSPVARRLRRASGAAAERRGPCASRTYRGGTGCGRTLPRRKPQPCQIGTQGGPAGTRRICCDQQGHGPQRLAIRQRPAYPRSLSTTGRDGPRRDRPDAVRRLCHQIQFQPRVPSRRRHQSLAVAPEPPVDMMGNA
jgi:hypothetical protein